MRRGNIMRLAACLVSLAVSAAAAAQFPAGAVRIIVPFPPGGGADALARLMAPKLSEMWKQPVLVENKPGASGHIGAEAVAQSAPDGTTLLMSSTASLTEKNLHQFAPVTLVSASPYVLTAHPSVAANNVAELIALTKVRRLSYGSSGVGAASHLAAELFKAMAQVDLLHVPYKGTGQALTDLLGGQIDLMFAPGQTVVSQIKSGKLRALATTGRKRSSTLPELPTVAESGLPGYEAVGWFGLLAPAATLRAVVDRLSRDSNAVLADRGVREKMEAMGAEPAGNTPEEFARFIRDDLAKWSKLAPK